MEHKQDRCPYCGGEDLTEYRQDGYGRVHPAKSVIRIGGQNLIHLICRRCGTVVRSYVENPDALK